MPRTPAPVGTERPTDDGYIMVKTEHGWKLQHRAIMEEELGRPLRPWEQVHHHNHVRSDNRRENLAVVDSRDHARHHLAQVGKVVSQYHRSRTKVCKDCGKTGQKKIQQGRCRPCREVYNRSLEDAQWAAAKARRDQTDLLWLAESKRRRPFA